MRRRLRYLVAALSLVLCMAALGTWLRSVQHYDRIDYTLVDASQRVYRTWTATSNAGQCTFGRVRFNLDKPAANPSPGWTVQSSARSRSALIMWPPYRPTALSTEFSWASRRPTKTMAYGTAGTFTDWSVTFPHWVVVVLFFVVMLAASVPVWKRFSLRLLFGVTTIVAAMLGYAIWLNS